ncbi:MAG: SDR family oxidoreductase [bacterium]
MSDKKYLVIGASGLLGLRLAGMIARDPHNEVVGSWRSFKLTVDEFRTVRLDLAGPEVGNLVREFKPDIVYHLASETSVDICEKYPERVYKPVETGLFALIDACNQVGGKLIFISSDGIFGRSEGKNYEDTLPSPVNVYGRSKMLAEGVIRSLSKSWIIVRCCPVGHHPLRRKGLIGWLEQQIRENRPVTGWTDCRFSPLTVGTLAEKLMRIQSVDNRIVHLYSAPGITKYDFLCRLVKIFGASPETVRPGKMGDARLKVPRPRSQVLSSKVNLGIETAVPIEREFEKIRLVMYR